MSAHISTTADTKMLDFIRCAFALYFLSKHYRFVEIIIFLVKAEKDMLEYRVFDS